MLFWHVCPIRITKTVFQEEEYKNEKELREEKLNEFREEKRNILKRRLAVCILLSNQFSFQVYLVTH